MNVTYAQKVCDTYKQESVNVNSNDGKSNSIACEKIYSSDNVDYLLSLGKRYLKQVRYKRDNKYNCIIDKEFLYEKVNQNEADRLKRIKGWEKCNGRCLSNNEGKFGVYRVIAMNQYIGLIEQYFMVILEQEENYKLIGFYKKR